MNTQIEQVLPERRGSRPQTGPTFPHQQLSQNAPAPLQEEMWRRMTQLEGVSVGRSNVSLPDTRALHLDPALAGGPREAFMAGTEFAHLHGPGDGSLHLALPLDLAAEVARRGWGEPHPAVATGMLPGTHVMIYGPRDGDELETVWGLVQSSYQFARWGDAAGE